MILKAGSKSNEIKQINLDAEYCTGVLAMMLMIGRLFCSDPSEKVLDSMKDTLFSISVSSVCPAPTVTTV